jgi:hypothetical protein
VAQEQVASFDPLAPPEAALTTKDMTMARAKQPPRGTTKDDLSASDKSSTTPEDEGVVANEEEPVAETEDTTPLEAEAPLLDEAVSSTETESTIEAVNPEPVLEPALVEAASEAASQAKILLSGPTAVAASSDPASFHSVLAETTHYSKTSLENGWIFLEDFLGAKSLEGAVRVQSEYIKTSYVDFITYLTKVLFIYSKLAQKTLERRTRIG